MDPFWCFWLVVSLFIGNKTVVLCDQNGFLSLSCGGTSSFVDSSNIPWIPDSAYTTFGKPATVEFNTSLPLRFFLDSSRGRKCYKLPLKNSFSSLVLVRTEFVYRNYDGLEKPPAFTVSLGTSIASTVNLTKSDPWIEEFVWPVTRDTFSLCFQSLPNSGFPVISSIEIRPLPQGAYSSGIGDSPDRLLRKRYRINCGSTNGSIRYPLDQYDRIWDSDENYSPIHLSSGFNLQINLNLSNLKESPPVSVLQTARFLARWNDMVYNFPLDDKLGDYYIVLYFAGILPVSPTFDVLINGDVVESNYTVKSWEIGSLFFIIKGIRSLNVTFRTISFNPLVNGIEVYEIVGIPSEASSTTVSALQVIQQSNGLDLGWEDDPCSPTEWDHIGCEGSSVTSLELFDIKLRSISPTFSDLLDLESLDLHNTSLTGEIQNLGSLQRLQKLNLSFNQLTSFGSDLEDLGNLQILDLQNNSLQGIVPESLGELTGLHLLNLENNKLRGPLPHSLNRESLEIRTLGNLCLSFSTFSCKDGSMNSSLEEPQFTVFTKKKQKGHNHIAVILGLIGGIVLALSVLSISAFLYLRRKKTQLISKSRGTELQSWFAAKVYSYKEIKVATNNFKEMIGRGSFGSVYLGKLPDGKAVAVKVRFDKTQLGSDSFINEVSLLSRIRHQKLVSLEGFCCESKHQILVYEYLPGGSLANNLYGKNSKKVTLSWIRRLKIAVDAAKGLDYLHNGTNPRIIHRDVKSCNILLDMEMNAKVCDFGLSKQVIHSDASHVTTAVKGTAGYLDPEYYSTQQLTEKSDIYSFGVVLLELICGREPLTHSGNPDSFNLVLWAKPYLQAGAFEIVDESLKGSFEAESMRKAALIASLSVERDASRRPTIGEVLEELQQAYSIQLSSSLSSPQLFN